MNPLARTVQTQHPSWVAPPAVTGASAPPARTFALLASSRFEARTDLQTRVIETLGGHAEVNVIPDAGDDLAVRLEAGLDIPDTRRRQFLAGLPSRGTVVVLDGLFLRTLRVWRPGLRAMSLGEALLRRPAVTRALRPEDLLVIDSRGFHAEHTRLVKFYDRVRAERGCDTNLDLQRVAIPTGAVSLQTRLGIGDHDVAAQVRWIMEGRAARRVVVEAVEDLAAFGEHGGVPVCHLAEVTGGAAA